MDAIMHQNEFRITTHNHQKHINCEKKDIRFWFNRKFYIHLKSNGLKAFK